MTLPVVDLDLTDAFGHLRIVPVVVIHDAQDAEPLALALKAGGLVVVPAISVALLIGIKGR